MNGPAAIYDELNKRWKSTCRVLFGSEAGELADFEPWLKDRQKHMHYGKSGISGKKVAMANQLLEPAISLDEADFNRKFDPMSINEIKDIDSIVEALQERITYCGNIVLGNSGFVQASTDVMDSFYILDSVQMTSSKHIAYGDNMEYCDTMFGVLHSGFSSHSVRLVACGGCTRSFELWSTGNTSDSYYCASLLGCKNCMFSFNMRNANYAIGNVVLEPSKYAQIKKGLMEQMVQRLGKEKRLPSLDELMLSAEPDRTMLEQIKAYAETKDGSPISAGKEFAAALKIIFGPLSGNFEKYEKWLMRSSLNGPKAFRSAADGKVVWMPDYANKTSYPADRVVQEKYALALGALHRAPDAVPSDLSLDNAGELMAPVAYLYPEYERGKNSNMAECYININSSGCYRGVLNIGSKDCAYNFYTLDSNAVFGSNSVRDSSYSFKCYCSRKLTRCLEVDSSRDCSDSYFIHNCENVHDSMFCFNTKNKRNAIGNAEIPKEKYLAVKEKIKAELADELEKTGDLEMNIFNLLE